MQTKFGFLPVAIFLTVQFLGLMAYCDFFVKIPLKPLFSSIQTTDLTDPNQNPIPSQNIQSLISEKNDISRLHPQPDKTWSFPQPNSDYVVERLDGARGTNPTYIVTNAQKFDFSVEVNGRTKNFYTSRTFRNNMLLAGLLHKLGYKVPQMTYVPTLILNWTEAAEKEKFKVQLKYKLSDGQDWIVSETTNELVLRDLVMYDPTRIDLSRNYILQGMISNQRKFEALLVPWTLVNLNESLNKEPWYCVTTQDEVAYLFNQNASEFNTNLYDIRWIAQLIKRQIKPADIKSLIANAHFPEGISILVEEVFKSRINSITKTFLNEAIFSDVNPSVNYKDFIKDSRVDRDAMLRALPEKTVTRFASIDPVVLIDNQGLKKLSLNIITSNVIDNLLNSAHDMVGITTDISGNVIQQLEDKAWDDLVEFSNTGKIKTEQTTLKSVPYIDAKLAYSSDLVLGNYGGTKNLVQRVDVFGYFVGGGILQDFTKFSTPYDYVEKNKRNINLNVGYQKFYVRIKPIFSLKEKKQEGDSSFIPLWINGLFGEENLTFPQANGDLSQQSGPATKPEMSIKEKLRKFTNDFRVGESFVLTETTAGKESLQFTVPLQSGVSLYARLFADQKILSRIHIHRISESQLQIYKDNSNVGLGDQYGFEFAIDALMPIFSLSKMSSTPDVKSEIYMVDLNQPAENLWPALKHLFVDFNISDIKPIANTFKVTHDITIKSFDLNVLFNNVKELKIADDFTIEVNKDLKKNVYYNSKATKSGNNFPKFFGEIINGYMRKKNPYAHYLLNTRSDIFSNESFLNTTQHKEISYEHDLDRNNAIFDQVINIKYIYKTPSITKAELMAALNDLNSKYDFEFFDTNRLAATEKIILFNFLTQITINQAGLKKLLSYSKDDIMKLSAKFFNEETCFNFRDKEEECSTTIYREKTMLAYMFGKIKSNAFILSNYAVAKKQASEIVEFMDYLESRASMKDLIQLLGGVDNVYIQAVISGFRKGDETALAQKDLYSRTLGRVNKYPNGPFKYYTENLNLFTENYSVLASEIAGDWATK
jgi:hypothetical protein